MSVTLAFAEALTALERRADLEPIVGLFSETCEVGNAVSPKVFVGREGAREFWRSYRSWFGEVESAFHNVIDFPDRAAIEWSSMGTSRSGRLVAYEGMAVLEYAGGEICRFRAYFNPDALTRLPNAAGDVPGSFGLRSGPRQFALVHAAPAEFLPPDPVQGDDGIRLVVISVGSETRFPE